MSTSKTQNYTKDFDGWNKYQKQLELKESPLFDKQKKRFLFHEREIWYASVA